MLETVTASSQGWTIGTVVAVVGVGGSFFGWVYKQLQRLIEKRFDSIDHRFDLMARDVKKSKKRATKARKIAEETKAIVDRRIQ